MSEKEFETKLFRAYFRRFGKNAPYPSSNIDHAEIDGKPYVVLSNAYGILAVYRIRNDNTLKYVSVKWFESRYGKL